MLIPVMCVVFCLPFVVLAAGYGALPPEVPVLGLAHTVLSAPKSMFMVFRVPLMSLIHGLMAGLMLFHAPDFENPERRKSYSNIFFTLLCTVALKSNFEALWLSASAAPMYSRWLGACTLTSVVAGLGLALWHGRRISLPWRELRFSTRDKFTLAALFAVYVAIVVFSVVGAHRQA